MPHIVFNKTKLINVPSSKDGIDFNFIATSYNFTDHERKTEYKIAVTNDKKDFLLTLKDKDTEQMIKIDKVTRIAPITLVKDALNAYTNSIDTTIVFENTNSIHQKAEPFKEYLKDINYFVTEFKTEKEIQIEVGFGSGRHLLHQAKNNPDVQFIGLEIHTPSIEQALKQMKLQDIANVLIVNYDARLFMEFIDSNAVGKIFVHFPVPWDKKPHRRIYSNEFINEALRVLKVEGTLELRTDSRKYFDYCTELLTNLPTGKITIDINKDLPIISKYEDRWRKQGKNIYDVTLQSHTQDEALKREIDFTFDFDFNYIENLDNLPMKPIVDKGFFIHIEDLYIIENKENSGLIQITMGNFDRPVSKYLLVENKKVSYYQGAPLPTSSNINAHKKLKEILQK